jgi:protoporphyrinogen/coproporphyrinogen III oxidase
MVDPTFDVAVLGAGISGLACAHLLARASRRCVVLEAAPVPGGCIHTERGSDGFWFELGAHTLYDSYSALLDIMGSAGLHDAILGRVKAPFRLLVEGKVRSVPSQLVLGELFASAWRIFTLRKENRSVGEYYGRLVGPRNWRRVFSPLLSAVPSQRADDFPAEMLFKRRSRRKEFPRSFTLENGLLTLIERLAGEAGIDLRVNAAATALARTEDGFTVTTAGGAPARARHLVLALPPDVGARLLAPVLPATAAALGRVRTTAIDSTGVVFAKPALPLPRLAGLVPLDDVFFSAVSRDVVPDEQRRALAFHFRTGLSPEERLQRIAAVTGAARESFTLVAEHHASLPSPALGHGDIVRAIDESLAGTRVYVTGNYFGGLAIEDCVLRSTAEARRLLNENR